MKPIGPLMVEHRLIERMVALLKREKNKIDGNSRVDVDFLMLAVDFMRTYADRTHHGKEEDILFKALAVKQLKPEHLDTMNELIAEHVTARQTVSALLAARADFINGVQGAAAQIASILDRLAAFYPAHIIKEDKHFFYPCVEYMTDKEQQDMLQAFWEFDRKMIHEKYGKVVAGLE